ncbi:MAG: nucleotidyltransferase family protein, partial [Gemmatimonadota bacterium]
SDLLVDAMIFAAGLGTRLQPLTDTLPKALVPVAGVPMLERVARRLIAAGADRLVINAHWLGHEVERFVRERGGFGVETHVVREPGDAPLETGGGLRHAAGLLRRDAPFFLHNSDVLTDLSLVDMYDAHARSGALVTLAMHERDKSRALLFDADGLCGHSDHSGRVTLAREPRGEATPLGFTGVHVAEPRLLDELEEEGAFSVIRPYLRLAGRGERLLPYRVDGCVWMDIGTMERLAEAERWLTAGTA